MPAPSTATTGSRGARRRWRPGGHQRGVDAAGERLDEHGPLVGDVVADAVQLAVVGPEPRRPAAAGRAAEAGLDAGLEVAGGEVGVVVAVARRGALERRRRSRGPRGRAPVRARRACRRRGGRRPRGRARTGSSPSRRSTSTRGPRSSTGRCRRSRPARVCTRCEPGPGQLRVVDLACSRAARPAPRPPAPAPTRPGPARAARPTASPAAPSPSTSPSECLDAVRVPADCGGHGRAPDSGRRAVLGCDALIRRTAGGARARPSAGRTAAAGGGRRWPSTSARRASRACGRSPPGGSPG